MVESLIARLPLPMRRIASFAREVWKDFHRDHGIIVAAAVSFYVFLSIFPLLLLGVAVLGFILGSPDHALSVLTDATGWLAVGEDSKKLLADQLVIGKGAAIGIGSLLLLWSGMAAFVTLESAMNLAWNVTDRRGYIGRRAIAILLLLVVIALALVSFGITAGLNTVHQMAQGHMIANVPIVWSVLGYAVPVLVSLAMFVMIYKILPNTHVRWSTAFVGALFAGVFWEIAKLAFTYYVVHFARYNQVYGPLGGVILLLVWIDYSSIITLLGAEVATVWQRRRDERTGAAHEN